MGKEWLIETSPCNLGVLCVVVILCISMVMLEAATTETQRLRDCTEKKFKLGAGRAPSLPKKLK